MKTIAQQLNIKEFPLRIKDSRGNEIYLETSKGSWYKQEFDSSGNVIYYEDNDGYWCKYEYDSNNNQIYFENSDGKVKDKRPKCIPEYTMEELIKMLGKEFKIKK